MAALELKVFRMKAKGPFTRARVGCKPGALTLRC